MSAETVDAKAARLLEDGRITIVKLIPRWRVLTIQGDSGPHPPRHLATGRRMDLLVPSHDQVQPHRRRGAGRQPAAA